MAIVTTLATVTVYPSEALATLADGTWQEFSLPSGAGTECWRRLSIKVTGNARVSFDQGLSDGGAVGTAADYSAIVAADGWLTWHVGEARRSRPSKVFVAGDGATPVCYVSAEGE